MTIHDAIKSQIEAGKNAAEVKTHLRTAGFTEEEIDSHTVAIKRAAPPPRKRAANYWMLFTAILLFIKAIIHFYQQNGGLCFLYFVLGIINLLIFFLYKN